MREKPKVLFQMQCTSCGKNFISVIDKLAPCPYCNKLNDNVKKVVFQYKSNIPGKFVYVDALTGKFLKVKQGRKELRS